MGFGGIYKKQFAAQNQLTDLSNKLAMQAGEAKQQAANAEAQSLRQQGDMALFDATQAAELKAREGQIAAANQTAEYLAGGVLNMGTPLAVANDTRRLSQAAVDALNARGRAMQGLYYQQAGQAERGGMSEYLQAIGATAVNSQQTKLSQETQRSALYQSLISQILPGALSLFKAVF